MSLDDAGTPRQGETGSDGVEVLAEKAGKAPHRLRCVQFGLADPLQQQVPTPVADQVREGAGEVADPGDARAGEPDLKQPLILALGEGVARPHDPGRDHARAGDVGPDRFSSARP